VRESGARKAWHFPLNAKRQARNAPYTFDLPSGSSFFLSLPSM
jgi:hypothetical protein